MTQTRTPRELRFVGLVCSLAFAFPGLYLIWRNFTSGADPLGLLLERQTLEPFGVRFDLPFLCHFRQLLWVLRWPGAQPGQTFLSVDYGEYSFLSRWYFQRL